MELVNGYYCRNCAEVELAKKGVDPAHPKTPGSGAGATLSAREKDATKSELGVNRPNPSGDVGTRLNLQA